MYTCDMQWYFATFSVSGHLQYEKAVSFICIYWLIYSTLQHELLEENGCACVFGTMHPCLYFGLLYCICCVIYVDVCIVSLASPYPLRCYCAIAEGNTEGRGWLARLTSIANGIPLPTHSVFYMLEACVA